MSNVLCICQSFTALFFSSASWFFTTALVYQLRCVMLYHKVWVRVQYIHMALWPISLLLATLPLSTNPYGQNNRLTNLSPCSLAGSSYSGDIWDFVFIGGLFIFLFVVMSLMMARVAWEHRKAGRVMAPAVRAIYNTTRLYPLGLFITWLPKTIELAISLNSVYLSLDFIAYCAISSTQYGTIVGFVFFYGNPPIRQQWYTIFQRFRCCMTQKGTDSPLESRSTVWTVRSAANSVADRPDSISSRSTEAVPEDDYDNWVSDDIAPTGASPNTSSPRAVHSQRLFMSIRMMLSPVASHNSEFGGTIKDMYPADDARGHSNGGHDSAADSQHNPMTLELTTRPAPTESCNAESQTQSLGTNDTKSNSNPSLNSNSTASDVDNDLESKWVGDSWKHRNGYSDVKACSNSMPLSYMISWCIHGSRFPGIDALTSDSTDALDYHTLTYHAHQQQPPAEAVDVDCCSINMVTL